jgi:hypothetical protein
MTPGPSSLLLRLPSNSIDVGKVLAWIHSAELAAVNVTDRVAVRVGAFRPLILMPSCFVVGPSQQHNRGDDDGSRRK